MLQQVTIDNVRGFLNTVHIVVLLCTAKNWTKLGPI